MKRSYELTNYRKFSCNKKLWVKINYLNNKVVKVVAKINYLNNKVVAARRGEFIVYG